MSNNKDKGVLFLKDENGEPKWFENGDEDNDGKYLGIIENGKPNGQGTYTLSDGGTFEGYLNGFGNGNGKHTDSEGKVYEGEFKDGEYHGQGTYTFPDGTEYVGEWKNGKTNCQGKSTYPD